MLFRVKNLFEARKSAGRPSILGASNRRACFCRPRLEADWYRRDVSFSRTILSTKDTGFDPPASAFCKRTEGTYSLSYSQSKDCGAIQLMGLDRPRYHNRR